MKKVLITGVTGQDGSLMADYLLANTDHTVIAGVRRLSVSNHKNIEHLKGDPRFQLIDLDVTDSQNTEDVLRTFKPDFFINFAANSFVGSSWRMPEVHMKTNFLAVLYQLEAIRKFAPLCRYYNAGSSEEFGDVLSSPQNESHPPRPRSPYAASKVAARQLVKVWRDSYCLYAVQGWLFNHEGVRRGAEFVTRKITKEVARIKASIEKKENFTPLKLGNLDSKRDWSDAEDFVDGIWKMLNQNAPKEYVLASGETHSIREFVELAFEAAGIQGVWVGTDLDEFYVLPNYLADFSEFASQKLVEIDKNLYRPAEVDFLWGDSSLARTELGWNPATSFEQLVKKMVSHDISELSS